MPRLSACPDGETGESAGPRGSLSPVMPREMRIKPDGMDSSSASARMCQSRGLWNQKGGVRHAVYDHRSGPGKERLRNSRRLPLHALCGSTLIAYSRNVDRQIALTNLRVSE